MPNTLLFDLKKNLLAAHFLLGAGALLVLMLSSSCTVFNGQADQPNYNYIQFLIFADRREVMSTVLYCDIHMFIRGFGGEWLAVFLPMLTGLACVPMLCDELNSGAFRMIVTRRGRRRYILSKLCAAALTAMLMLLLAAVLFGVFCLAAFPSPREYLDAASGEERQRIWRGLSFSEYPLNSLLHSRSRALVALSRLITLMLYSALPCLSAMLMGALTLNKFVSLSVPVMVCFTVRQIALSAVQRAYEHESTTRLWFFDLQARLQYGETQFEEAMDLPLMWFYIYPVLMSLLLGAAFYRLMKGRVSC
ncbi:MAG: hypothetical protein IJ746_00305 [Ruminococcus sp.]|nr:hypothetical protein [Ruminococcus sp.]